MSARLEEKSDHELLQELLKSQKESARNGRISAAVNIVLLIILVLTIGLVGPKALSTLNQAEQTMKDISAITAQAEVSLQEIDRMVANVNELVEANNEELASVISGVSESAKKLQDVDIESLNESIKDLGNIIGPLARLFR